MNSKLFTGTLDLLILDLLGRGDSYGFEITQMVLNQSGGRFELKEGSLYPALHRLERQKLIKGYWRQTNAGGAGSAATSNGDSTGRGRRRKYYALTAKGNKSLEAKRDEWDQFVTAMRGVLGAKAHRLVIAIGCHCFGDSRSSADASVNPARLAAEPASRGTRDINGAAHGLA